MIRALVDTIFSLITGEAISAPSYFLAEESFLLCQLGMRHAVIFCFETQ